jgi:hypothetical protein
MNKTSVDLHMKMLQNKTPGSESHVLVYSLLRGREIMQLLTSGQLVIFKNR